MRLQNPMTFGVLAIVMGLVVAVGCGDDDDDQDPVVTPFTFTIENLPHLAGTQYYETWVTFPLDTTAVVGRVLHGDDLRESLGQFIVNQNGDIEAPEGGAASFSYSGSNDLNRVETILITVETVGDSAGPAILGGVVVGNDDVGRATLTMEYHHAVVDTSDGRPPLDSAAGSFILATPTNGEGLDENQGIWFTDPTGNPTLTLPTLAEGWIYSAHVFEKHATSIGTFTVTDVPDSDGAGAEADTMPGFNAPGSDFLDSAPDLADGVTEAFVVIQPASFEGERGARALHDTSFPLRVLATTIALGAPPRQTINLVQRVAPWPTAEVTFPR